MNSKFAIVIDSREQKPWFFEGLTKRKNHEDLPLEVPTSIVALKQGDYSILGHEDRIAVERKSVSDLIGTISRGRERFERELERLQQLDFSAVVVEGSWGRVLKECFANTSYNPAALDASILTFSMRYPKTHWIFRPSRFTAMKTTYKLFDLYFRRIKRGS